MARLLPHVTHLKRCYTKRSLARCAALRDYPSSPSRSANAVPARFGATRGGVLIDPRPRASCYSLALALMSASDINVRSPYLCDVSLNFLATD